MAKKSTHCKIYFFFLFLKENIYCGYSLEAPLSNEYPQHMFSSRNKKKNANFRASKLGWASGF